MSGQPPRQFLGHQLQPAPYHIDRGVGIADAEAVQVRTRQQVRIREQVRSRQSKATSAFSISTPRAASASRSDGKSTERGTSSHSVGPPPGVVQRTPGGITSRRVARQAW